MGGYLGGLQGGDILALLSIYRENRNVEFNLELADIRLCINVYNMVIYNSIIGKVTTEY